MKTIKVNFFLILVAVVMLLAQCKEEIMVPLQSSTVAPGEVSNIRVENLPAKALLKYTLPTDKDLLYVKAVYLLKNGLQREVKSSFYSDSLIVDGFSDTLSHEVKLYAVNRSEIASNPVTVMVTPLRNPIYGVFGSLNMLADFGGVQVTARNVSKGNVAISLFTIDPQGKWSPYQSILTSDSSIIRNFRGLDTIPIKIGVTVRDRFLNYTDTLIKVLSPLYEIALTNTKYKELFLPTDAQQDAVSIGLGLFRLWDGSTTSWQRMMTVETPGPQWISINLGQMAYLSRINIWGPVLVNFEVWGSANPPIDGSFNNWIMLGKYNVSPSWDPLGVSFNFFLGMPKCQYIRIKTFKNLWGTYFMDFGEIQVYGDTR